jgi:hypothetical protein
MTTRDLSAAVEAALAGTNLRAMFLIELRFGSGTVYVNNLDFPKDYGGHTWLGGGRVGSISAIEEGEDLQAYGLRLTLSGIDPSLIAIALDEDYQGRTVIISLALLDANHNIVETPVQVYRGRMDTMPIEAGQNATITLNVEGRLVDFERPRVRRYNAEDQKIVYPTDEFFQYVPQMVSKELYWGMATPAGVSQ